MSRKCQLTADTEKSVNEYRRRVESTHSHLVVESTFEITYTAAMNQFEDITQSIVEHAVVFSIGWNAKESQNAKRELHIGTDRQSFSNRILLFSFLLCSNRFSFYIVIIFF